MMKTKYENIEAAERAILVAAYESLRGLKSALDGGDTSKASLIIFKALNEAKKVMSCGSVDNERRIDTSVEHIVASAIVAIVDGFDIEDVHPCCKTALPFALFAAAISASRQFHEGLSSIYRLHDEPLLDSMFVGSDECDSLDHLINATPEFFEITE